MKSKVLLAALSVLALSNSYAQDRALSFSWENVGPDNVVSKSSSIIVSTTDADSKTLILGSESNGLYRSTNKGSSWQQIEVNGMSRFVSNLHQAADGKIYAATGVIPNYQVVNAPYGYIKIGNGLWVSNDAGLTYTQLSNTVPAPGSTTDYWASINKVVSNPANANEIFVGTNSGFSRSTDGGATWSDPILVAAPVSDIDASASGQIIVSYLNGNAQVSVDGGSTFVNVMGAAAGQIPTTNVAKVEFAISATDNNYVYACAIKANGWIEAIYSSTDKGLTWSVLTPGSTYFAEALYGSGVSNSVFEVFPGEKTKLVLAGSLFYTYSPNVGWTKRLSPSYGAFTSVAWDSKNANNFYTTTNSGVYRTYEGAYSVSSMQSITAGLISPDVANVSYSSQYSQLEPAQVYLKFNPKKDTTYSFIINQKINSAGDSSVVTFTYKSVASSNNETEIKTNFYNQVKTAVTNGNLFVTIDTATSTAGVLKIYIKALKSYPEFIARGFRNFIPDFTRVSYPSSDPIVFITTQFAGSYYIDKLSSNNKSGVSLNTASSSTAILAGITKPIFEAGAFGDLSKSADLGENWSGGENVITESLWSVADVYQGTSDFTNAKSPICYVERQNADSTFSQRIAMGTNADLNTAGNPVVTANKPAVWISKNPTSLSSTPSWLRVGDNYTSKPDKIEGKPSTVQLTYNHDYVFAATNDGTNSYLYRVYVPNKLINDSALAAYEHPSNIDASGVHKKSLFQMDSIFTQIRSTKSLVKVNKIANFGSRTITGIYLDPNDQSRVLVSLGGYGFTEYLYLSNNADSCASANNLSNFTSIQGNLSGIPVNSAVIDVLNNNIAVIATNEGIYYTENLLEPTGNCNWTMDTDFPAKIATCLTQVTNQYFTTGDRGNIYAGTLGKGAYVSKANLRVSAKNISKAFGIKVYPNPSKGTFTVSSEKTFDQIVVRNITGQTVLNKNLNAAELNTTVNLDLPDGVYVYEVLNKSTRVGSGKVLISK